MTGESVYIEQHLPKHSCHLRLEALTILILGVFMISSREQVSQGCNGLEGLCDVYQKKKKNHYIFWDFVKNNNQMIFCFCDCTLAGLAFHILCGVQFTAATKINFFILNICHINDFQVQLYFFPNLVRCVHHLSY